METYTATTHCNLGLGSWPSRRARQIPNHTAWVFEGDSTTYAEVEERVERLSAAFVERGIEKGDRIAYLGTNHPSLLETLFASARAGAITVLINPRLSEEEVLYLLADCGAQALVLGNGAVAHNLPLHTALPDTLRQVIYVEPAALYEHTAHSQSTISKSSRFTSEKYTDLLASDAPTADIPSDVDDPCLIMYTSGTTGRPKGAVLSHGNLFFNHVNTLVDTDLRPNEISLAAAPMYHAAMLNGLVLPVFLKGGRTIIHATFDADAVLETLTHERITSTFAVPVMMDAIAQSPHFAGAQLKHLRTVIVGGAPIPMRVLTQWLEKGVGIQQGYGLTETAPGVLKLDASEARHRIGSAGKPQMFVDVRLVDDAGQPVSPGDSGEILTRGPNVFLGYWNREDDTDSAFSEDGWFRTGDIASADSDGFLYLRDRSKDMYISGGENVYPAEVESAVLDLPGVLEAAIIGVPDARWGEVGHAYVVLRPGTSLTLAALRSALTPVLAKYKLPQALSLRESLPRTATGKLQKHILRRESKPAPAQEQCS